MRWLTIPVLCLSLSASAQEKKIADKSFWLLTAASYASGVADEEVTQYKLGQFRAIGVPLREANPLLGNSRKQAYPVMMGITTLGAISSYYLKRRESKLWWVPQTLQLGVHGFAVGWNLKLNPEKR